MPQSFFASARRLLDYAWQTAFRIGFPFARFWWRLAQPRHKGALVAVYVDTRLLLVRSSYRTEWNFPGGGVRSNETPEAAARRELAEEIGLISPPFTQVCVICGLWDGRRDQVTFFELRLSELPTLRLDNREIVEARLMSPTDLDNIALTGPVAAYLAKMPVHTDQR